MSYLVFCTFDIEGLSQDKSQLHTTYNEVYAEMERIGLSREYNIPAKGLGLGSALGLGQGLMNGMLTTPLTGQVGPEPGELPSTSVAGHIFAASPMEAVMTTRRKVETIFNNKGLKGRAFVVAATNEECDRFVF